MNNDKELLELAAKAAGYDVKKCDWVTLINCNGDGPMGKPTWNPLTNDGDALRLMVKLAVMRRLSGIELFPSFVIAHHHDTTVGSSCNARGRTLPY